jgi:signal transduction histidine kinase
MFVRAWSLFATDGLMPHGHCYLWEPSLVFLQVSSNLLIGLAYIGISSTLAYLIWRVRDIPFQRMYIAFGVFIISCGLTHLMDVWTVWTPLYWLDGWLRAITAAASVLTALMLPPLVPQAIALAQAARTAHTRGIALETAYKDLDTLYQQQQELDRTKTHFFASVSHELRTPLTLIIGPVDRLLDSPELPPAQRHDLEIVRRNAEVLLGNVNDLLDIARSEAGKLTLRPEPTDLAAIVRGVADHFAAAAEHQGLQFQVDMPPSLPAIVDASQIERVLLNLLSNAFKFTPPGGRVHVILQPLEPGKGGDGGMICLSVGDSGPGVPAGERERVFERFYQSEATTTRRIGGTGLGLAIVRDIVDLHRGAVSVQDAPEGGALFVVSLPWVRPSADAHLAASTSGGTAWQVRHHVSRMALPQAVIGPMADGQGRVLVVEDNAELSQFLAENLQDEFAVDQAYDGVEGVQMALDHPYDLILTDLMMPRLDGEQLIETLRQHPRLDSVPIIVLTAKVEEDIRARLLREGAQDYLIKPFNVEELTVRVRQVVTIKRARDLLQQELSTQIHDMESLAREVSTRQNELQQALTVMRLAREEAERANLAKSTFLHLVSHELRTPLTTLKLHLDLLKRDDALTPAQQDRLRRLTGAQERLLHMVETVLSYTQLQSGRLVARIEPVDVDALTSSLIDDLREHAGSKGLTLNLEASPPPIQVDTDPVLLRIVLANLVENAIKYTPAGDVCLCVDQQGDRLHLAVSDTGPGIPPEDVGRVFEPFEQVAAVRRKSIPGVGLGLTIVRDILATLGGTISVRSELGQGTRFDAYLPLRRPPPGAAEADGLR